MHCIAGQPLVSVLFVAVLIALFLLKTFSLLVCTLFCLHYMRYDMGLNMPIVTWFDAKTPVPK